jgi:antitoxin (DNA-binding transcriptional repressor) of toxin-antitoxin stability system
MTVQIDTEDAERDFHAILQQVEDGEDFLLTQHGIPIARIRPEHVPSAHRPFSAAQEATVARNLARLRACRL